MIAGLSGWFLATAASQHPQRTFDRLREYDALGLMLPNWRFFAPEPAQHDFHVLHRVLTAGGEQTPWVETRTISPRRWSQAVWFPDRRREKGISDVINELLKTMTMAGVVLERTVPYELLRDLVEVRVRAEWAGSPLPRGFQFLIARHTGHDAEQEPDYLMASPFVALAP